MEQLSFYVAVDLEVKQLSFCVAAGFEVIRKGGRFYRRTRDLEIELRITG
jgi:hypothetical protein